MDFLEAWCFDAPSLSLVLGSRGAGKSYLSALHTHLESIRYPRLGTRILGGSMAQSEQIYNALRGFSIGPELMTRLTKQQAEYRTGSHVAILAATATSVRGPHVARLKLDEVDEIDADIRDAALGMSMERDGISAAVMMTSTWHNVGGPMGGLIEKAKGGDFPLYTFCVFDILERCPDERSGPGLENCPACPIVRWCHADRDERPSGLPKAKRSRGHYAIDSLVQKTRIVSDRVFEADYLCSGPKAAGLWFPEFSEDRHVSDVAEYDPALPAYLAVDSGVFTGAVWYQVSGTPLAPVVTVFADYLGVERSAESNARAILEVGRERCNGQVAHGWTDPAGGARNPIGPSVLQEYARVGLHLRPWPVTSVADSLNAVEGLVNPADGRPRLRVHPRCVETIRAFRSYRRAKTGGQWRDWPLDPQHSAEDMIDALRGGVYASLHGRRPLKTSAGAAAEAGRP